MELETEVLEAYHVVNDPIGTAGGVLYWGEGAKTNRHLSLANADPAASQVPHP
ncbi:MAG: hypothetical protein PVG83_09155 [Acidimicrobiia bacterium]